MSLVNENALAGMYQGADPYPSAAGTEAAIRGLAAAVDLQTSNVQIFTTAGVPVDYTDGTPPATGEAKAEKGALCVDSTNGKLYINGGTKAQPLWKIVTSA